MLKLPLKNKKKNRFSLDEYNKSVLRAAYSLRKTKTNVTKGIRVRRSSDSTELDIGFVGTLLDIVALLAFCGSGSGFIKTWYDPSGNGNDATMTTADNQPRIVNAGILERDFDYTKANATWSTFASASGVTLVSNGNFASGTTGWSALASTLSASSNTLSVTGTGTGTSAIVYQTTAYTAPLYRRLYITAKVRVTNASCTKIETQLRGSTSGIDVYNTISSPVQNQWYTITTVTQATSSSSGTIRLAFAHYYADAATANGKVMEVQEVVAVDITEYGQPALYFDGSNDVLTIANSSSVDITAQPLMINAVFRTDILSTTAVYVISKNVDSAGTIQYALRYEDTNTPNNSVAFIIEGDSVNKSATNTGSVPEQTQKICTGTWDANSMSSYVNASIGTTTDTYSGTPTSRANMQIGARSNNAGGTAWSVFFKGYISEIIILTTTTSRSKLERNQGNYYKQSVS